MTTEVVEWHTEHDNLCLLIRWMASQHHFDKHDLAHAVEKPWRYRDEYLLARRELDG